MKTAQTITTFALVITNTIGFIPQHPLGFGLRFSLSSTLDEADINSTPTEESASIRVPLKNLGPYPAIGLRFPNLATSAQRERNVTGVSLDFVVDTAANINTINAQVAQELLLEKVGTAPAGVGAGGALDGGETFLLGDIELEGLDEEPFTFMTELTASALQIASPASAGLLGTAFLNCFEGGVDFSWGQVEEGEIIEPPSFTFHGEVVSVDSSRPRAKIHSLDTTLLPSVTVNINGHEMPALLDTGSPVTVMNSVAAKVAGVDVVDLPTTETNNPFTKVQNNMKIAKAASRGEVLQIAGSDGPVNLLKSISNVDFCVVGDESIDFGANPIFVGDLPGLAALDGIGADSSPAVVLGTDILRKRPKMLFRGQQNEVYF